MHCFPAVRPDEPAMIRLRGVVRVEDEISQELNRATDRNIVTQPSAILLSLPGVGSKVAATMLSEASQAISNAWSSQGGSSETFVRIRAK